MLRMPLLSNLDGGKDPAIVLKILCWPADIPYTSIFITEYPNRSFTNYVYKRTGVGSPKTFMR